MLFSVRQESQTSDEAYSLFAGYIHLKAGDFSICPAYPPLTKEVAALPLLAFHPAIPPMTNTELADFRAGRIFLYAHRDANRAGTLLFAARAAMTVFPLLLALLVFLATREMFGAGPAFIALALVVFEPNLLAHGPLITNDTALACWLFATVYAFWRYVVNPGWWRLVVCGIAAGLTLATKHSGVIVFPILVLLALAQLLTQVRFSQTANPLEGKPERRSGRLAIHLATSLAAVLAISIFVLWSFYGFRYAARPGGGEFSAALGPMLRSVPSRNAVAAITVAGRHHLLPESYLEGLAFFYDTASRPTYLLGTRYVHGVWFYFPTALAIKSTLGFLLLLVLAPFARLLRQPEKRREALWMLIPAGVYLAASMTSNLDIGVRHILPIYPLLAVWVGAAAWKLGGHRAWKYVVGGLVLIHAASSLRAFPDYLPYSNELWGGPTQTYQLLTDSNVDWGQGLPAVKRYLETHAATPCWFAYFGTVDPAYFGIPCTLLTVHSAVIWERPLDEVPPVIQGTVFVSATEMSGQSWGPGELNPYEQFRTARPVASLAGSILVYQGTFHVPLASALSRNWKVVALANHGQLDAAITEARAAEALAPQSVDVQFVLGRALRVAGHKEEARQAFLRALQLAQTIHPEAQTFWIPILERELFQQ